MTMKTFLYVSASFGFVFETDLHRSTAITVMVKAETRMLAPEERGTSGMNSHNSSAQYLNREHFVP